MTETFHGQELDCPDKYLTEWHSCPACDFALIYCECDEGEGYTEELAKLYAEKEKIDVTSEASD